MGEQPLFSCRAHVFQLEPELKKSWIPLSSTAVNVQIFHDPLKNIYRIVSIEGTKALINSIVTPKMTFTKTSQKFGQWIDFRLNFVYGLGFPNDAELNRFVEKFKEIKDLTRINNNSSRTHERSNSCEMSSSMNRPHNQNNETPDKLENTLKYENDRLKLALSNASSITRKYEAEIHALRTSNSIKDEKNLALSNQICEERTLGSSTSLVKSENSCSEMEMENKALLKNELVKLSGNFEKKLSELHEINEKIKKVIDAI